MSVTSLNSRASLAGAFCCNWYLVCTTKTGISIMSFRSADKYIGHMLTHLDSDIVFDIADLCRDAAPARPKHSLKAKSVASPKPKQVSAKLTKANLASLSSQFDEEAEEEDEVEYVAPVAKKAAKKTTVPRRSSTPLPLNPRRPPRRSSFPSPSKKKRLRTREKKAMRMKPARKRRLRWRPKERSLRSRSSPRSSPRREYKQSNIAQEDVAMHLYCELPFFK